MIVTSAGLRPYCRLATLMLAPAKPTVVILDRLSLRRLAAADIADLKNTSQAERLPGV